MIGSLYKSSRRLLGRVRRALTGHGAQVPATVVHAQGKPGLLATTVIHNLDEYATFYYSMQAEYARRRDIELALIGSGKTFVHDGYCYVCGGPSTFISDFLYADGTEIEGKKWPNWRERVTCQCCQLNNRIRGSIHFLEQNLGCTRDAAIYISEQSTQLYRYLKDHYPNLVGSEYFGERLPFGATDPHTGYRNESVTQLTFADSSLDFMLSFDVFEHVPDYLTALRECRRCLKPGGKLLYTVPFNKGATPTEVRARIDAAGNIEHLCEPTYHGDPINKDGCLCYYTFGWELLAQIKALGFKSSQAHMYWSREYAYLGHELILLSAER